MILGDSEIENAKTFGYAFLPIFEHKEVGGDTGSNEVYVNTSVNQLPILEGPVDKDLLFGTSN